MHRCQLFHSVRILKIMQFEGAVTGFMLISQAIIKDQNLYKKYTEKEHRKKIIESLEVVNAFNNIESIKVELLEKAFQDLFHVLEAFVTDCFISLFCCYPIFLRFFNNNSIDYQHLADKTYLSQNEELINAEFDLTIERISKNKPLLQQIETLNKLPVSISIPEDDQLLIKEFTKLRNLIVHNDGRITMSYSKWKKMHGIDTRTKPGHYLVRDYLSQTPFSLYKDLIDRTINTVVNALSASGEELDSFKKSLIEEYC